MDTALNRIVDEIQKATRPTTIVVANREYLVSTDASGFEHYEAVYPPSRNPISLHLGSIYDFCAALKTHWGGEESGRPIVGIADYGVLANFDHTVLDHEKPPLVKVPFYGDEMPPVNGMDYEALLLYLDEHTGSIQEEEVLRQILSMVRIHEGEEISVEDSGPSVTVGFKKTRGVDGGGGQSISMAKFIGIKLHYGAREIEVDCRFRLSVSGGPRNGIRFDLKHVNKRAAIDSFVNQAKVKIAENLGDGWEVYQG